MKNRSGRFVGLFALTAGAALVLGAGIWPSVASAGKTGAGKNVTAKMQVPDFPDLSAGYSGVDSPVPLSGECCTEAGYADECWWESADDDGVTCAIGSSCSAGSCASVTGAPNPNVGLCPCSSDSDCGSDGVCNADNLCGPSWCNGYLICSCFGGCVPAQIGSYATPQDMCTDTGSGYPGFCCNGTFPDGLGGSGYCSDDPTCNEGCTDNADCNDGNPCTYDKCISGGCLNVNMVGDWTDSYTDSDTGVTIPHIASDCAYNDAALHMECALPACVLNGSSAVCDILYEADGSSCDWDPSTGPNGDVSPDFPSFGSDDECYHGECNVGVCEIVYDDGGSCDSDGNVCTDGVCDTGDCDESDPLPASGSTPNLGTNPECCDPSISSSYIPSSANDCMYYYCDSTAFTDGSFALAAGSACDLGGTGPECYDPDDGECDGSGNCDPVPLPAGSGCTSNPEPDGNVCSTYYCNGSGSCVVSYAASTYPCWDPAAMPVPSDDCVYAYCDGAGACDTVMNDGDPCIPPGGAGDCEVWECDYSDPAYPTTMYCTFVTSASPDPDLETCNDPATAAQDIGVVSTGVISTISDSNECADDDYDALTGGRFNACAGYASGTNNSDYVYEFDTNVSSSAYQLYHVVASVERTSTGWDPYLHYREGCDSSASGSGEQYTCNNNYAYWSGTYYRTGYSGAMSTFSADSTSAAVTAGPWPMRDYTNSSDSDGIVTEGDWSGQFIVDTWNYSNPLPGGDFDLDVTREAHYNADCYSSAAYLAAPIIDNFNSWKERFRGTTNHSYYVNRGGTSNDTNCGTSTHTSTNPVSAYFRVELDDETDSDWNATSSQWEDVDWESKYKATVESGTTRSPWNAATTLWNGNNAEGPCGFLSSSTHSCGGSSGSLQEHIINDGTADQYDWLELSNYTTTNAKGNYEVEILRVPREFFGFKEAFAGDDTGCTSSTPNPANNTWSMGGRQLDFFPTNDKLNGYMVRVDTTPSTTSAGWLVNPSGQLCSGTGCTAGANASVQVRPLPFKFPYSGHFFDRIRIDAAGRIDLGTAASGPYYISNSSATSFIWDDIGNSLNSNSNSAYNRQTRYNPMMAPMWGKIIPCMCSVTDTSGGWGSSYTYWDEACYNDGSSSEGRIYLQNARWDNSTVTVITWDGFDGYNEPTEPICTASSWGSCTSWECNYHNNSSSDRARFIQFQVILRQDGRFTFFYKTSNSYMQNILDDNGWMVGISGTWHAGTSCASQSSPDSWCDLRLGETSGNPEISCDDDPGYAPNGDTVFTPGYWCHNTIENLHNGLAGTWQTGN